MMTYEQKLFIARLNCISDVYKKNIKLLESMLDYMSTDLLDIAKRTVLSDVIGMLYRSCEVIEYLKEHVNEKNPDCLVNPELVYANLSALRHSDLEASLNYVSRVENNMIDKCIDVVMRLLIPLDEKD